MQITLLGGFEVVVDGHQVPADHWRRRHAAALVKLLALAPRRVLHRERVIDALWPDLAVYTAAPRLRKAAHYARQALGRGSVVLAGDTVALCPDAEVTVDALRFQQMAHSAHDARTAGQAADAYQGDLLPDDLYAQWTDETRQRLRLLYLRMLHQAGRWYDILLADPCDESVLHQLVTRWSVGGQQAPTAVRAEAEQEINERRSPPGQKILALHAGAQQHATGARRRTDEQAAAAGRQLAAVQQEIEAQRQALAQVMAQMAKAQRLLAEVGEPGPAARRACGCSRP